MHWQCAKTAKELQTEDSAARVCCLSAWLAPLAVFLSLPPASPACLTPAFSLPAAALSLLLAPLFAFAIDEIVPQHAENSLQLDTLAVMPVEGAEAGRKGRGAG